MKVARIYLRVCHFQKTIAHNVKSRLHGLF